MTFTTQRRQQQAEGRDQGFSRAAPANSFIVVQYCQDPRNKDKPHSPISDEGGIFCGFCGEECGEPDGRLTRDLGTETKQNRPVHPGVMKRMRLGTDLYRSAYDLAGMGRQHSQKAIVKLQKKGGHLRINDRGQQLEIVSNNNEIGPATKSHIKGSEYREDKLTLETVRNTARGIISRFLENRGYDPNKEPGLTLGAEAATAFDRLFAETITKLTIQPLNIAVLMLTEATSNSLILELCERALTEVMAA